MLCLHDLAELTDGRIHFGPLPPREGEWTAIRQIALESRLVVPGDLFWRLPGHPAQTRCSPQDALFRGAAGVVTSGPLAAPLPGTFCLEVDDELAALTRLMELLDEKNLRPGEKLKKLQLCGGAETGITPATCDRPTGERLRCRGRAA